MRHQGWIIAAAETLGRLAAGKRNIYKKIQNSVNMNPIPAIAASVRAPLSRISCESNIHVTTCTNGGPTVVTGTRLAVRVHTTHLGKKSW